jgi:hypothetical protein
MTGLTVELCVNLGMTRLRQGFAEAGKKHMLFRG